MTSKATILIVDDEPFNVDYLEQELEDSDYVTVSATNGREALEKIQAEPPDMVLLDIMMPEMDGFAVLETLKAEKKWRDIPVVVISAMDDIKSVARGIELGAEDYLPKPFDPVLLMARISAGLEKKRLRDLEQQYLHGLERELKIGRAIQRGFLPREIPQPKGWEIATFFRPARLVSGDFYDAFELPDGNIALMVGDVCDKGVGSALYMALYRSLLRAVASEDAFLGDEPPGTEQRLQRSVNLTNLYICQTHRKPRFITLFFGILDPKSGDLQYISAGHDPPILLNNGKVKDRIMPTGPLIGFFEDAQYGIERIKLQKNELLLIYTDGVIDAENGQKERFEHERLEAVVSRPRKSAAELLENIDAQLSAFTGDAAQFDDVTLLAVLKK
jgi:serine phosphatase RsbU (regulator of sigma subunit)